MNANGRRVVITGRGIVSALGNTPETLFARLAAGDSAVRIAADWGTHLPVAPVDLPEKTVRSIPRAMRRSMGRVALLSALAGRNAAEDAKLKESDLRSSRTGCVIGSTMGSAGSIEETFRTLYLGNGMTDISPMAFFKCASHTTAFNTAHLLGMTGMVYSPSAACASGLQAVGIASSMIRSGEQDIVLAGGADEVNRVVSGCFELMNAHAVCTDGCPENVARPFERTRNGLVCGEGAGVLVLEEYEHAKARGADILAEVYAYATCQCPDSVSQSDSASILRCLHEVYRLADLKPEETDYINAHATSTIQGDLAEAVALRRFFGSSVPVSSMKGHLGHTLGASGVLETVISLEMMKNRLLIPTRNLNEPDPACEGLDFVRTLTEKPVRTILKNCFAFGGINSTLLFGAVRND